jgi:hypothetical protein
MAHGVGRDRSSGPQAWYRAVEPQRIGTGQAEAGAHEEPAGARPQRYGRDGAAAGATHAPGGGAVELALAIVDESFGQEVVVHASTVAYEADDSRPHFGEESQRWNHRPSGSWPSSRSCRPVHVGALPSSRLGSGPRPGPSGAT